MFRSITTGPAVTLAATVTVVIVVKERVALEFGLIFVESELVSPCHRVCQGPQDPAYLDIQDWHSLKAAPSLPK